jgi:hypothetical protein
MIRHGEEPSLQMAGSQNSSWMLSGSRNTITDPIGVSAIGVYWIPRTDSSRSHSSSAARVATLNAKWSRPVRDSSKPSFSRPCRWHTHRTHPDSGSESRWNLAVSSSPAINSDIPNKPLYHSALRSASVTVNAM